MTRHAGAIERVGFAVLVLALAAGLFAVRPRTSRIVLLDVSASVTGPEDPRVPLSAAWRSTLGALPCIAFAGGAAAYPSVAEALAAAASGTLPFPRDRTRLASALRLAREIDRAGGDWVVVGDGGWEEGESALAAVRAGSPSRIHGVALRREGLADARVTAIGGPGSVRPEEPFHVSFGLEIHGAPGADAVDWVARRRRGSPGRVESGSAGGEEAGGDAARGEDTRGEEVARGRWVPAGAENVAELGFEDHLPGPGWWVYDLSIALRGQADRMPQNDRASLVVSCGDVLRVGRIVRGDPGALPAVPGQPRVAGSIPGPLRPGSLDGFDLVTLENLAGGDLEPAEVERLAAYARAGGTVVFFGGERSFGRGASEGSALDAWLPLQTPAPEGAPRDIVLLVDRSGSMAGGESLRHAQSSLRDALARMPREDRVWLVSFHARPDPPRLLKEAGRSRVEPEGLRALRALEARGGTRLAFALDAAAGRADPREHRELRVLVASDGRFEPADVRESMDRLRAMRRGGTRVWFAAPEPVRREGTIDRLALAGGGTWVDLEDPGALGRALVEVARPGAVREGPLAVHVVEGSGLAGFTPPPVRRLLVSRLAPGADLLLEAEGGLPLAAWRREGRGRVVAWAGHPGPGWMEGWEDLGAMPWAWVLRTEAPPPGSIRTRVEARPGAMAASLEVPLGQVSRGIPSPRIRWLPAGPWRALEPRGPGAWGATIEVPRDARRFALDGAGPGGGLRALEIPHLPAPEWLGGEDGESRLARLAASTSGILAASPRDLPPPPSRHGREPGRPVEGLLLLAFAFTLLAIGWFAASLPAAEGAPVREEPRAPAPSQGDR